MTINVKVTPEMLCDMCGGRFTYDACEAICNYFEQCGNDEAVAIGDICISFSEIPSDWNDEYNDENLVALLDNGNALIIQ